MDETIGLWALFSGSFLAATLLPGGSEIVLFAVLKAQPDLFWTALFVATIGNTLGGMSSFLIGRIIPHRTEMRGLARVRRHGVLILLLSWVPIVGDSFCVAAGWLRLDPWLSAACMAAGKFSRYFAIAYLTV